EDVPPGPGQTKAETAPEDRDRLRTRATQRNRRQPWPGNLAKAKKMSRHRFPRRRPVTEVILSGTIRYYMMASVNQGDIVKKLEKLLRRLVNRGFSYLAPAKPAQRQWQAQGGPGQHDSQAPGNFHQRQALQHDFTQSVVQLRQR